MARAHGIAVVPLHCPHISEHVVAGHGFATLWVMIVTVNATNRDALTIHPNLTCLNANTPKPGNERSEFSLGDATLNQLDDQSIPMWVFSRPRTHMGNQKLGSSAVTSEHIALGISMWHIADDWFTKFFARQLFKPHLNRHPSSWLTNERHLGSHRRATGCRDMVVVDIAFHRTHMDRRTSFDEH